MKKIFMASFVAMMAVTAANADIASTKYVTDRTGNTADIAQGLGTDLTTAINTVNQKIDDGEITITDRYIKTNMIDDGAVTNAKIADNAVTSAKIANEEVKTEDIAPLAVTTAKIADLAVTTGKIADNNVTTGKIADKNVTAAKLADGVAVANIGYTPENVADKVVEITDLNKGDETKYTSVKAVVSHVDALKAELSQSASQDEVRFSQIEGDILSLSDEKVDIEQGVDAKDLAVITDDKGNVTTGKIVSGMIEDGEVKTLDIADFNVTTGKIADLAVTTAKIADNAVTSAKIANEEVKTEDIAPLAVTTAKIADNAVTSGKIANGEVKTDDIAEKNVTKAKLAQAVQDSLDLADSAMQEAGLKALSSWTAQKCGTQDVTCSLVSKSGVIAWEAVQY